MSAIINARPPYIRDGIFGRPASRASYSHRWNAFNGLTIINFKLVVFNIHFRRHNTLHITQLLIITQMCTIRLKGQSHPDMSLFQNQRYPFHAHKKRNDPTNFNTNMKYGIFTFISTISNFHFHSEMGMNIHT